MRADAKNSAGATPSTRARDGISDVASPVWSAMPTVTSAMIASAAHPWAYPSRVGRPSTLECGRVAIRVLLVDDHELVRQGIAAMLAKADDLHHRTEAVHMKAKEVHEKITAMRERATSTRKKAQSLTKKRAQ